jgi:hypothetical protein
VLECVGAGRAAVLVAVLVEIRGGGGWDAELLRAADEDAGDVAAAAEEPAADVEDPAVDAALLAGAAVRTRYTGSDRSTL